MQKGRGPQFQAKEEQSYNSNVNPFEDNIQDSDDQQKIPKTKKVKKDKKHRKDKKEKKSKKSKNKERKMEEKDYDDEEEESKNSMFDDEAESGEEDYEDEQYEAEVGYQEQRERYEQLYNRPNATQKLLERFKGKNEKQINAQYSKKALAIRQQQDYLPGEADPKLFSVQVQPKTQDEMVLKILNKARFMIQKQKSVPIFAVLAFKKRYPGKIFVEAHSQREIRQFLEGFINVYLGKKILKLQNQEYGYLFTKREQVKIDIQENNFVRIKKGLYQGDLAKVYKVKKSSIDVLLVPRICIQDIKMKIRSQTQKLTDQKEILAKKQHIFKLLTDHRQKNYRQRPLKKQIFQNDFIDIKDIPGVKNIRISNTNGLIIQTYRPQQIEKVQGSYLPVQVMPFTTDGNFIDELKEDLNSYATCVNFKKGEQVQIIAGDLEKHYGILTDIKGSIGVIKCKNKQMRDQILQEPLIYISKRFKIGQKVKINSGLQKGKVGIILTIFPKQVQVWTENQNSMKVSKRILQVFNNQTICEQNINKLNKNDLIKTNKNFVGVVLQTTKDTIKFLDTNNIVQVINNIDFDSKITIKNLIAKGKFGEQIESGCIVLIKQGIHQGKKGRVLHVFRQSVFIFNQTFNRNFGIHVEDAQNCSIISKNSSGKVFYSTKAAGNPKDCDDFEQEEIKLGQVITLKTGALKGYKAIVKSITRQKFQVRIPSKGMTEWIPRRNISSKQDQPVQASKTPNRLLGSIRGYGQNLIQD